MNYWGFLPWLLTAVFWVTGGWLIATHAFTLERKERLLIGLGLGLVLYAWLINLLGRFFESWYSFFIPAVIVFLIGCLFSWKSQKPFVDVRDLKISPWFILALVLFGYSVLLERGLGIYDDYHHLPAISSIAAGNLPPKYILNASFDYSYHYGFEVFGASLMRLGNMFPWSAFDIGKSIVWFFSIVLIALILCRYFRESWKVILGIVLYLLIGGTRYLFMLLPANVLQNFDPYISFIGVSQDLNLPFSKIIYAPWYVGGGPPSPFIYGFSNSLNSPYLLNHMGEWPMAFMILALLWLLAGAITSKKAIPVLAALFSHLALTYESAYGLLMLSLLIVGFYIFIKKSQISLHGFWFFAIAAAISIPFVVLQGGSLMSVFKGIFSNAAESSPAVIIHPAAESIFSLQWPPSIFSSHFGALSIFSIPQLIVGILEIGPILFFAPSITRWVWREFRKGDWVLGMIIISTWVGFLIALVVSYNLSERDITRFSKHAFSFWILFFILMLLSKNKKWGKWTWRLAILCTLLMAVSGVVNGWIQQSAIPVPVLSDGIDGLDAEISSRIWGKLNQEDLVFDPTREWRATALTGLLTVASIQRETTPEWEGLSDHPSLQGFADGGYRYLYVDEMWWRFLSDEEKSSLSNPCIQITAETQREETHQFRRLLDFKDCTIGS